MFVSMYWALIFILSSGYLKSQFFWEINPVNLVTGYNSSMWCSLFSKHFLGAVTAS